MPAHAERHERALEQPEVQAYIREGSYPAPLESQWRSSVSPNRLLTGMSACSLFLSAQTSSWSANKKDQIFNFRDFKDDFFLDQTMLRRIERANEADRHRDDYDDSRFYDDEEDENLISDTSGLPAAKGEEDEPLPRGARSVSRAPKRERMSMGRN